MKVSPWDIRLGARTVSLSIVTIGLAFLVDLFTRERSLPGATPSIGVLPVVPLAVAIAAGVAVGPARSAGELASLVALGVAPLRTRAAAVVIAALLSAVAGTVFAVRGDVASLFPQPTLASDVRAEGHRFVSPRKGIAVDEDDVLVRLREAPKPTDATSPAHRRAGAGLALGLAGLSLALYLASPVRRTFPRAGLTIVGYGAAQVLVFQLSGANRWPALLTCGPALGLFAVAGIELSRSAELRKPSRWI